MLFQPNRHSRTHRFLSLKRQRGVVIVIALFVVALIAAMAYTMMVRVERDTERTRLILRDTQAEYQATGSLAWAIDTLSEDLQKQKPEQIVDPTPIHSPVNKVDGYKITTTIYDMQARFNLNNLTTQEAKNAFQALIKAVLPKLSDAEIKSLVLATVDWINASGSQTDLSKYYTSLAVAYRVPHNLMFSATELQLVKGMTPALFKALQPYIAALPEATQTNVETAEAPVLSTLSPSMTLLAAKAILQARLSAPITSLQAFLKMDVVNNHHIDEKKITDKSNYFLVETKVAIDEQNIVLYTLLERSGTPDKPKVTIVWQSKGFW